ncbi:hypothetical protein N7470_003759 [Penicillium chermesinum]|nr:hypothetical protein N7470_003759 [Penicillium chermesinum]
MVNLWDSANVARQGERFDTTAAREWGYVIIQRHDWRLEARRVWWKPLWGIWPSANLQTWQEKEDSASV